MYLARFRRIRVGLGSLFSCLLLLLGLFTLTGTASAYVTQTLHTHAASTGALVDASCSTGQIGTWTFVHSHKNEPPKIVCHRYPLNPGCAGGAIKVTFVHSHKNEPPKIVCNPNMGDPYKMQFSPW